MPETPRRPTNARPAAASTAPFAAGESIETAYGGVLYLLNAALHLGLYPDFTQPRAAGLALSPWTFLALAGERLAGRGLRRDALWPLLATCAGVAADEALRAPGTLPPPALSATLRARVATMLPPNDWAGWLEQLIPPLRRRLAAALGVPSHRAGRLLCCQRARVRLGIARLDAHFSLDDHPVAIRRAGLDRDPGWIPAVGCDVRFLFDD